MNYKNELEFIVKKIKEAYQKFGDIDALVLNKDSHDIVTNIDLNIEKFLIKEIKAIYPDDYILSEESNHDTSISNRTWTIDPIDGTFNLANNIPWFGIQVALICDNEVVLSVIYLPKIKEMYTAIKNEGSYLNGKKIKTKTEDIKKSIIAFSDFSHQSKEYLNKQCDIIKKLASCVGKVRIVGASCFDFTFLALGKFQGYIMLKPNIWDVAPGLLIAREAGVIINYNWYDEYLIASTSEEINNLIKKCVL